MYHKVAWHRPLLLACSLSVEHLCCSYRGKDSHLRLQCQLPCWFYLYSGKKNGESWSLHEQRSCVAMKQPRTGTQSTSFIESCTAVEQLRTGTQSKLSIRILYRSCKSFSWVSIVVSVDRSGGNLFHVDQAVGHGCKKNKTGCMRTTP